MLCVVTLNNPVTKFVKGLIGSLNKSCDISKIFSRVNIITRVWSFTDLFDGISACNGQRGPGAGRLGQILHLLDYLSLEAATDAAVTAATPAAEPHGTRLWSQNAIFLLLSGSNSSLISLNQCVT